MKDLKFNKVEGDTKGSKTYGRWVSECGRVSIMKFNYKAMPDPPYAKRVTPYYNAYDLTNYSRRFASGLRSWRGVLEACRDYHPETVL